ncbi:TerC family protein [Paraperlucidibaca wandonensis]|jgi:predicted tellurium resistance membrane protein TerC|uniref:TerC family protein n=1 Tax=Paraperlucidibaca wandonensis TaxID=1268273 RepID=A0ABW3HJU5_9GAMM|nr:TerC family protein [Paraperlucidibaca sp.]MBQ0723711.1 TerC family protein [Paraperlucidibaca sp.]MBQ0843164.1 TerC family protein [Paraperlucidibaca sp.]
MFEWIADPQAWITLATLSLLEIVLGIDNIIFLTILVNKVAPEKRQAARVFGLGLAMVSRIALLLSITWVMRLTEPLVTLAGIAITGRDLILIGGGLFLLWKSATEIFDTVEGESAHVQVTNAASAAGASFFAIIVQIAIIDIVFSLDSVITAVGLADDVSIMVIAIVLSVIVMMFAAKPIGEFVDHHPSIKVLALAFLVLVGTMLIAEGFGQHMPKGYIYGAMAFSVMVEMLNIRMRKRRTPKSEA